MKPKAFAPFYESELACERRRAKEEMGGVSIRQYEKPFPLTELVIQDEVGAQAMGRPMGSYFTIELPSLFSLTGAEEDSAVRLLQSCLVRLLPPVGSILVVGLGNRHLGADAIGPKVIDALFPCSASREMYCIAPGVSEQSGISSAAYVKALVKTLRPACVLAIDAITARSKARLGCTLQLTDTGIIPGSGICRSKPGLTQEGLGVPVIAIGVPTMMHLGGALLELIGCEASSLSQELLDALQSTREYVLPDGIELATENARYLISQAINTLPACSNPKVERIE